MIPELPKEVSDISRLDFYDKLSGNLSDQSTVHVNWHTHRQNPSVCWICDLVTLTSKILDVAERYMSKSPLDTRTGLESESDSDSEIEKDFVKDDEFYNEPEYDTVDVQDSDSK